MAAGPFLHAWTVRPEGTCEFVGDFTSPGVAKVVGCPTSNSRHGEAPLDFSSEVMENQSHPLE